MSQHNDFMDEEAPVDDPESVVKPMDKVMVAWME